MNKTSNFECPTISENHNVPHLKSLDILRQTIGLNEEEEEVWRPIPLERTKTTKPPIQLKLNEDLYRLLITKDHEIIKSWITDKEIPNYVYDKHQQSIVKIDPNIPDDEDRRKLIPDCILVESYNR